MGDGVFVPDEDNAPIVQMIFSDYVSGMGARQIASKLNDMGIRTTKGNLFENRTVEYIITNPAYIGKLRRSKNGRDRLDRFHEDSDNTLCIDGRHEPIITLELFEEAQQKRVQTKKLYGKRQRQAPVEFMLKGMVRCSNCGATLVYQAKSKSLQCHNYARGTCKISHGITLKKINALVIDRITRDLEDGLLDINIASSGNVEKSEVSTVQRLLEKERKKLERVREAYEAGVDTLEEYRQNKEKISQRIAELVAAVPEERSPEEVKKALAGNIKATLAMIHSDASETAKNLSLRAILDRVVFMKPTGRIEIFYKG